MTDPMSTNPAHISTMAIAMQDSYNTHTAQIQTEPDPYLIGIGMFFLLLAGLVILLNS